MARLTTHLPDDAPGLCEPITGRIASNPSAVAPIRVAVVVGSAIIILGVA